MNTSDNNTNLSIIKQTFSEALQTFGLIMLSISIIKSEKEVILYFLFPLAVGIFYRLIKKQVNSKNQSTVHDITTRKDDS